MFPDLMNRFVAGEARAMLSFPWVERLALQHDLEEFTALMRPRALEIAVDIAKALDPSAELLCVMREDCGALHEALASAVCEEVYRWCRDVPPPADHTVDDHCEACGASESECACV